jgi:hypothetical protein
MKKHFHSGKISRPNLPKWEKPIHFGKNPFLSSVRAWSISAKLSRLVMAVTTQARRFVRVPSVLACRTQVPK